MKVRFLRLSSFAILLQLAVTSYATRMCSLVDNRTQATFLPDPDNCRKFVVCVHGVAVSRYCPAGLHWNRVAATCDYPARAKCKNSDSLEGEPIKVAAGEPALSFTNGAISTLCPSGDVPWKYIQIPYPEDCTKFLKCSNGRIWIFDCPRGLQWNVARNRCDLPINVKYLSNEIKEKIIRTTLAHLKTTLATFKSDLTKIELTEDTTNEPYTTGSIEISKSPWLREKQSSATVNSFEETTKLSGEQRTLFNIDVKETISLQPDFDKAVSTSEASKPNRVMAATPIFPGEKTMAPTEKTVPIGNSDTSTTTTTTTITTTNSENKTIISDLEEFRTRNRHTIQRETEITAIQETTNHTTKQLTSEQTQTNIDRPITKTPEIFTSKSTNTTTSIKQTTTTSTVSISKEMTISQYDKTSNMENKRNEATLKPIEEIREQPVKKVDYVDTTKTRKFKAVPDTSLLLFATTINRTLYNIPLSKNSLSKNYHVPKNTDEYTSNSSSTQDKTALAHSATESTTSITTTTFDPRLPFKAIECEGINNEERFPTTDCGRYYQCHNGYAYLLNCFDGYTFSAEQKICLLSDSCVT